MAILRKHFKRTGVVEIPAFPSSIQENWCHPDLYLSIRKNTNSSYFTFQNFKRSNSILMDKTVKTPDLIWLTNIKAECNDFIEPIKTMLEAFAKELGFQGDYQYFDFEYTSERQLNKGEAGCFWNVLLAGVECGRLSIYSSLPGDLSLKEPSFILTLRLNKIINIYHRNNLTDPLSWAEGLPVSESMALIAWEKLEKPKNSSVDKELEDMIKATKTQDVKYCLCNVFELYSAYSEQLNKNHESLHKFNGLLKELTAKIVENE